MVDMNKKLFFYLGIIILFTISNISLAYSYIPPTLAFDQINTTNGTVKAKTYLGSVNLVPLSGMSITANDITKTIYFSAGHITPVGDRFGWFAVNTSPNLQNQHFYNFSTGHGISAFVGADDFILSAIDFVNATSKICPPGDFISSYDNTTGIFVCSPSSDTFDIMQNIGGGQASIYAGNTTKTNFDFKTLNFTGSLTGINGTNSIQINGAVYENNTGNNLGTSGFGVYSGMSGSILQFLRILCGNGLSCSSNSTNVILTSSVIDTNTAQISNADHAGQGLFGSRLNATHNTIKSISSGRGIGLSSNSTDVQIAVSFKVNNQTCLSGRFSSFDNVTGNFVCSGGTGATVTINGFLGSVFNIVKGVSHNVKITNSSGTITIDANNTAQISNADHAGQGLFGSRLNATQNTIKSITTRGLLSMTSNSTDLQFSVANQTLNSASAQILIYKNGTTYYAQNMTGMSIISSNSDIVNLLSLVQNGTQKTLNNYDQGYREIYFANGNYSFTHADLIGQNQSGLKLVFAPNARIQVPNGYSGIVFIIKHSYFDTLDGGIIEELGTPKKLWTGILLWSDSTGVSYDNIKNIHFLNCGECIDLLVNKTNTSFISSNTFTALVMDSPVIGYNFEKEGAIANHQSYMYNNFIDGSIQSSSDTKYCVKQITGLSNSFIDFNCWDIPATSRGASIDVNATNTVIIAGLLTQTGFRDNSTSTMVFDRYHSLSVNSTSNFKQVNLFNQGTGGNPSVSSSSNQFPSWNFTGKITPTPTSIRSGLNWGQISSDPSTLAAGDSWYNTASGFKGRFGGNNVLFVVDTVSQTVSGAKTWTSNAIFQAGLDIQKIGADFANGIVLRINTAKFATTIKDGSQTANNTLQIPIFSGTANMSLAPRENQTGAFNSTGLTSQIPKIYANGNSPLITLTPLISDNATFTVWGMACNSISGDGYRIQIVEGTTFPGINGATPTPSQLVGNPIRGNVSQAGGCIPFSMTKDFTGLTGGTKIYADLTQGAITGGTVFLKNVQAKFQEWFLLGLYFTSLD